jgi:hypothetical protein
VDTDGSHLPEREELRKLRRAGAVVRGTGAVTLPRHGADERPRSLTRKN